MTDRLFTIAQKRSGRGGGTVSTRHRGGRHKRFYRSIDWKRDKRQPGRVVALEYDPNRTVDLARIQYPDGEQRYILAPRDLSIGAMVVSGDRVDFSVGNAMRLEHIPLGSMVHSVELNPGRGGQLGRAAGASVTVTAKEGTYAHLKLPSGEVRRVPLACRATIGVLGNVEWKNVVFGTAGRMRHRGIRPTVRGVASNPRHHPHGGGEGRSGIGMKSPKTPWGKKTLGKKTRKKNNPQDRFIVQRRK